MCSALLPERSSACVADNKRPRYADYNDLMDMTEEMVAGMALAITGSYKVRADVATHRAPHHRTSADC